MYALTPCDQLGLEGKGGVLIKVLIKDFVSCTIVVYYGRVVVYYDSKLCFVFHSCVLHPGSCVLRQ
jgi:hypothetical protein